MADDKRIAGVAWLKADGAQYALAGTLTVSPDIVEREGKVGLSGVVGYAENYRVPYIEAEVHLTSDLSIKTLSAMTDVTVQAELANGRTYILRNAWCKAAHELNAADGTVSIRWEGMSGDEV